MVFSYVQNYKMEYYDDLPTSPLQLIDLPPTVNIEATNNIKLNNIH